MQGLKTTTHISTLILTLIVGFGFILKQDKTITSGYTNHQETLNDSLFEAGKKLFKLNCASCHKESMDMDLTAPALGGITKRRDKKWLYNYTRNSTKMLQEGDSIAKVLDNLGWGAKPQYPYLTDNQLHNIYYYVENRYQMTLLGIPVPIEFEYKFNVSENKRARVCVHILKRQKDILNISVSKNRFWSFSCDIKKHRLSEWRKTTLKDVFEYDNSISDVSFISHEIPATRESKNVEWSIPNLDKN